MRVPRSSFFNTSTNDMFNQFSTFYNHSRNHAWSTDIVLSKNHQSFFFVNYTLIIEFIFEKNKHVRLFESKAMYH